MEELHNQITGLVVHHINKKKIKVSEAVLVLEMIRLDLVAQVSSGAYTKKKIEVSSKPPTKLGSKHGVQKDNN